MKWAKTGIGRLKNMVGQLPAVRLVKEKGRGGRRKTSRQTETVKLRHAHTHAEVGTEIRGRCQSPKVIDLNRRNKWDYILMSNLADIKVVIKTPANML